ncbi:MAG: hypothetical protein RL336_112 [Pseudomonadota bacterium]|jgi:predicted phosphate transport protein (TIGR00153 family)
MRSAVSDLFGKSPIKPLQQHMTAVIECSDELENFMAAATSGDWETAEASYNTIRDIEHKADNLKRQFRLDLPASLFLPVPRTDLLELITLQDKIANVARDIAGTMLGRKMEIPALIREDFINFVESSLHVARNAHNAINELDDLLESGFRGKEISIITEILNQLDSKEGAADDAERAIRRKLLTIEEDIPAIKAMFLYKIIDKIGDLSNRAQRVGSRMQLFMAR